MLTLWSLLAACTTAETVELADAHTPAERLDAALPGLAAAAARYTDDLGPLADLVEAADADLVRLLLPAPAGGTWQDLVGDGPSFDLVSASAGWKDGWIEGEVSGKGVGELGAWLLVDLGRGPSPDLRLHLLRDGATASPMEGWSFGPEVALPAQNALSGDTLRYRVDLRGTRWGAAPRRGTVTALLTDGVRTDAGPAGLLGAPEPRAVELLAALVSPGHTPRSSGGAAGGGAASPGGAAPVGALEDPSAEARRLAADLRADPDLALAVALGFAPWLDLVEPSVRPLVLQDARERLRYGLDIDAWLALKGARWSLGAVPAEVKLAWAWPGGENVVYGALSLGFEDGLLSRERYRYHVPSVEELRQLRELVPVEPSRDDMAVAVDDAVWAELRYRARDEGMTALCERDALDDRSCFLWERDRAARRGLGPVDGELVPLHEATSVGLQLREKADEGRFIGDCTTATTLAGATWQALGIAPLFVGYAGPDWYRPTHNQPFYFDGVRFAPTQGMPDPAWDAETAWVYLVVPPLAGPASFTVATEASGWARGGALPGASMPYGAMGVRLLDGFPPSELLTWIRAPYSRSWPSLGTGVGEGS